MTQEEKLKEAKRLYESANADQRYVLESLFPELKESEDKKIKSDIQYAVRCAYGDNSSKTESVLAWLEKQVKCEIDYPQNHQDSNCPNGCIVLEDFNGGEGFYKVHLDYLNKKQVEEIEEMIRVWNKELKTSNENIKDCIGMCLTDVDEQRFKDYNTNLKDCLAWLEKQGKQKPTWSEEDENTRKKIIKFLEEQNYFDGKANEFKKPYEKEYEWLKSLKDRVLPQPKQEWSEEDRKIIIELIGIFESAVDGGHVSFPYRLIKDYIRVLKSCLPQSTWKPSEEQMDNK